MKTDYVRGHVQASFSINGEDITQGELGAFSEVRISLPDHGPARFEATFLATNPKWDLYEKVGSGGTVEISVGYGDKPIVFVGEVTNLRYRGQRQEVAMLVLEGSDRLHRMGRGSRQRVLKDVTDGDLVKKAIQEAGLKAKDVLDPGVKYPHIAQFNQTNLDFLMDRAARYGYCLWAKGDDIYFRPRGAEGKEHELSLIDDVGEANLKTTIANVTPAICIRGWDPTKKQEQVHTAKTGDEERLSTQGSGGTKIAGDFVDGKITYGDALARSIEETELIAKGQLHRRSMAFALGEVTILGDPEVKPADRVKIDGLGWGEEGSYYVGQVWHKWVRQPGEGEEVFVTRLKLRRNHLPEA